jgi:hypothetical protein
MGTLWSLPAKASVAMGETDSKYTRRQPMGRLQVLTVRDAKIVRHKWAFVRGERSPSKLMPVWDSTLGGDGLELGKVKFLIG